MCHDLEKFDAYARELLDAHASHEIEEVIAPDGEKATALKVANRAHFTKLMRDFIISEGMVRIEDFKFMDQDDSAAFGSLAHLHGIYRDDRERRYQKRVESEASHETQRCSNPLKIDPETKEKLLRELRGLE